MKAKNKNKKIKNTRENFENNNHKKEIGNLGEDIACQFLQKKKYLIIERNYLKKWGEIDIVAIKDNVLTFIEVKSVIDNYSSARTNSNSFRPEENVHIQKRRRLRRTIQTYMTERGHGRNSLFLFHVVVVKLNMDTRRAHVDFIENVIL